MGHRGGGPGRLSSADVAAVAKKLGVTTAQFQAALTAQKPSAAAGASKRDGRASELATALGVDTAEVQAILEANRPTASSTPPARATRPDAAKLVAALASGLGLGSAEVQAAFDKLQTAHRADHAPPRPAPPRPAPRRAVGGFAQLTSVTDVNCAHPPQAGSGAQATRPAPSTRCRTSLVWSPDQAQG